MKNTISLFSKSVLMFGLGSVVLFSGCARINSDKVAQSEVYTSYTAVYSEESDHTKVAAEFKVGSGLGGTNVKLTKGSRFLVNGIETEEYSDLVGKYSYYLSSRGVLGSFDDVKLEYLDNNGARYQNIVRIPSRVTFWVLKNSPNSFEIHWSTLTPISYTEVVSVSTTSDVESRSEVIDPSRMSGTVSVNLKRDYVVNSTFSVAVCRDRMVANLNAPQAGGVLSTSYCARVQTINRSNM